MRLVLDGEEYEVRVQKRQVTYVDILKSGRHLSRGEAVLNPLDSAVANDVEGIGLAAVRALRSLVPIIPVLVSPATRAVMAANIVSKFKAAKVRPILAAINKVERALSLKLGEIRAARKAARNRLQYGLVRGTGLLRVGLDPGRPEALPVGKFSTFAPQGEFPAKPMVGGSYYSPFTTPQQLPADIHTRGETYSPDFEGTAPVVRSPMVEFLHQLGVPYPKQRP